MREGLRAEACSAKCHQLLCHCFGPAPWPIKCTRLLCKTKTIKNDDKKQRQPSPLRTRLSSRSASPSSHSALALSMPLAEAPLAASTCAQRSRTHTHTLRGSLAKQLIALPFLLSPQWQWQRGGGGIGCCMPFPLLHSKAGTLLVREVYTVLWRATPAQSWQMFYSSF